jgi:hypothetical protein
LASRYDIVSGTQIEYNSISHGQVQAEEEEAEQDGAEELL